MLGCLVAGMVGYVKTMTLRLDDDISDALEIIADVEAVPVTVIIRDALTTAIKVRREDPRFLHAFQAFVDRRRQLLMQEDQS